MACILIAADDENLTQLMLRLLSSQGYQVVVVRSVAEAVRIVQQVHIDLAIVDANLVQSARQEGEGLCHAFLLMLRPSPQEATPIVILASEAQRAPGLESLAPFFQPGLDRVLVKPFAVDELSSSIAQLLRGSRPSATFLAASGLTLGSLVLDPGTYSVSVNGQEAPLTPIEFALLHFLLSRRGEVISTPRLLHHVWGYPQGVGSPALVRTHISNLRAKLNAIAPRGLNVIQTVPRQGYFIPEDSTRWEGPFPRR